ncbi:MAG: cell division topological specificity factor MinE [Firmicutes bacterium HGW-Firmicutes-12]|jgi:cell division topological specificity factor|nr:MAG: cell division topological specificity factor MinE [Firmicutes bacterium HGW-Firmicutes-12]
MDLFSKLKGKEAQPSKHLAKERLRLVLVHDRSNISPQLLECLKEDMMKVISKYMDIDQIGTEVTLNSDDRTVALVANIPIIKINRLSL